MLTLSLQEKLPITVLKVLPADEMRSGLPAGSQKLKLEKLPNPVAVTLSVETKQLPHT